jgi:uncharacterized membrane protein YoaK (UPF0700 family)
MLGIDTPWASSAQRITRTRIMTPAERGEPTGEGFDTIVRLHAPEQIFSFRHVPSWLMLAFSAGNVNAIALMACERFVTHVTGTVTRLGAEFTRVGIMIDFAIVLASFVAGAAVASVLINGRAHRGLRPLYELPLGLVALVTAGTAFAGHADLLGEFGGTVDEGGDFVLLSALAFASGLQNAAVATTTGLLVRTTHLTGPATDLGIHLAELPYLHGEQRRSAVLHASLRGGKLVAFAVGAAAGAVLARSLEFSALLVPAVLVLIANARSFCTVRQDLGRPDARR